ncbi:MAG: hypothetical protein VB835_00490 [Pirellulales bacterium]
MDLRKTTGAFLIACLPWLVGCPSGTRTGVHPEQTSKHVHDHPHHGPHDGELFAFDNGQYHAEAVADKSPGKVTIYMLDDEAKGAVMVDRKPAELHLVIHEADHDFKIEPAPLKDDPEGKTSRFELEDEELYLAVEDAELNSAKLQVSIDGKLKTGEYEAHDHGGHGHAHGEDDALVYRQTDIELGGCKIELGQHGFVIHAGEELEPAVSIVLDGKPVADAEVFVSLLAEDGKKVLATEAKTEYEEESEEEPAHYAGVHLDVPADAERVMIRYRIVLPADGGSQTFDSDLINTETAGEQ